MIMDMNRLTGLIDSWGHTRGIIQNGKPMGQAIKALEEVTELIDAINRGDEDAIDDAIGDVYVALVMCAGTRDKCIEDCVEKAYNEIKDRKGYLREDGVFVKETN